MRRTILLKPMCPGAGGYLRLQREAGGTLMQLHARGLKETGVAVYWYQSGQRAREMGEAAVNARGEACVEAEAPEGLTDERTLQAVLVISSGPAPQPVLIGLCAGDLLDAKNAALALCDRLRRAGTEPAPEAEDPLPPEAPLPVRRPDPPPYLPGRDVFLPAIDPMPYLPAREYEGTPPPRMRSRNAPAAWRLRPVRWPQGFETLRPYFENALPCALFDLPGWRFVYAADAGGPDGLWIGCRRLDGRVCGVAYAMRGDAPPQDADCQPMRGLDGHTYQVLWQAV